MIDKGDRIVLSVGCILADHFEGSLTMKLMRLLTLFVVFCVVVTLSRSVYAQGALFRGIGAVSEGFGSASTAAPLDAAGTIYWNPAAISGLQHSEMQFGMGIVMPRMEVSSDFPGLGSGTTKGSTGSLPAPSGAMVWKTPNRRLTLGFLFAGVGGAATMYRYDPDNPIMNPPFTGATGSTRSSNVQLIQALPTASYKLTRRLSVGVSPVLDMGKLEIHPSAIGGHSGPNSATGTRYIWGAGVHAGLFYEADNCFNYGFCVKSPQWTEKVMLYDRGSHYFDLNLPLILSTGVAYVGFRNTTLAMDVRYFDWGNTNGFREAGFSDDGTQLLGLGWESVFSVAFGVERKINKRLKLRAGYCWNENPIPNRHSMYNVSSPLIMEHVLSCGASWTFAQEWDLAIAYCHAFENKISGPLVVPNVGAGTVTSKAGASIINASVIKRF